ncbi:MFS transporter [Actinokineospora soli]
MSSEPAAGGVDEKPTPTPAGPGLSGAGLAVVLTGFALSIADIFIVNVALSTIGHDLDASPAGLEFVVSGYGITYAIALVLFGRLGDALGRRRLLGWGIAAFTATSALCGFAPTIETLIAGRLLQGAAAAMMVPQVLATIQAATTGAARAKAISQYGATAGLAAVAGQIIGGLLLAADFAGLGWRAVFMINVPIGAAALLFLRHVPETKADRKPTLDLLGTVLFGIAIVCLLVVIVQGQQLGWPVWLWALLAVPAHAAVALVGVERRVEARGGSPLLPPAVLAEHSMRTGLLSMIPFSIGFGAFMFVYALVAQRDFGLGPLASGLVLAPFASAFFVVSLLTPKIAARIGKRIVTLGALVQGTGLLLMALLLGLTWPDVPVVGVLLVLAFTGVGQALIGPTLFRMILADVPPSAAGMGSGVVVTSQQAATALGATVGGTVFLALDSTGAFGAIAVLVLLALFSLTVILVSLRLPAPR